MGREVVVVGVWGVVRNDLQLRRGREERGGRGREREREMKEVNSGDPGGIPWGSKGDPAFKLGDPGFASFKNT